MLSDLIRRSKNRVDIAKREGPNLSGGYIWKYDNNNISPRDKSFMLDASMVELVMVEPRGWETIPAEIVWLKKCVLCLRNLSPRTPPRVNQTTCTATSMCSYLDDVEEALLSDEFADPFTGYASVIDVPSFIDYLLIVELTKNPDGYRGSTFMHKVRTACQRKE